MKHKKYSALIIGANYGLNILYPILKNQKNIDLIGICSKTKKNLKDKTITFLMNWKKAIKIYKPDFVVLAVPPKIQSKIIKYLIEKKIPFFGQKPLSYNFRDAKLITKTIKKNKLLTSFDLNFLKLAAIIKFKKIINKKKLSNSKIVVRWFFQSRSLKYKDSWKNNNKIGGGILYNFGFHLFSILIEIFDDLKLINVSKNNDSYKLNFIDKNKNNFEVFLSNKKNNINLFDISVLDNNNNKLLIKNTSKNYHDNFTIKENDKILFVQKNSNIFDISRRVATSLNIKDFINDLKKNNPSFLSQNIDLCIKVHKIISDIEHK
ncbi:Gfo/Idh/MocA family oxidoreductase [Candidatus Pelagibacter sp. Uisw_094]|uniref:Gfo/Idh/MocA family oxidoreductase n=1 Tax=Candidatus Pelagibacter sp. Uisw_094 TaxID=3230980 RepID=UPI0039E995F6|tara:strand:- start:823 stop:1782 length:960 start_codon:yes stop_codon:yes gene_type:complete